MFSAFQKKRNHEINICDCSHFRGFRYGLYGNNLYEDYVIGLAQDRDLNELRIQFIKRLIGMRSENFGTTLGISLQHNYANWDFPWNVYKTQIAYNAIENPDIVCHTSQDGILVSHINREFKWLEDAYSSLKANSYLPEQFGYITVLQFENKYEKRYLVLDGNHRIASLAALGYSKCVVHVIDKFYLKRCFHHIWPGRLMRGFTVEDAVKIFDRYFWSENPLIPESENYTCLVFDEPLKAEIC